MKKRIHINQHKIRSNSKKPDSEREPVITIKTSKSNTYCHEVKVLGECTIKYGGNDKPILPCGARVVIETEAPYEIVKPEDYIEAELK